MKLSNFSNLSQIDPQLPEIGALWLYQLPFFYTYFANTTFELISDTNFYCGVAPYKDTFKIILGPLFIGLKSIKQKEGALIHEYLHIIMETFGRQGERHSELWNISTDYALNEEVLKHEYGGKNLELPPMVLLYKDLQDRGYAGKCIAEDIYDWIEQQCKKQQNQNDSSQKAGQGNNDNQQSSYMDKKNFDDHLGLDQLREVIRNNPIVATKAKKIFNEATAYHEIQSKKGIGSSSGSMYEFIKRISRPTIRWRGLLHQAVNSSIRGCGHKRYSWAKKNRKNLPFPGKKRFNKKVVLAIDTSGSIDTKLAERFFSEIDTISQNYEVVVVQFDTEVHSEKRYRRGDWRRIKFTGRGGTSCKKMFEYIYDKKALNNTVVVVFSDGGFYVDYDTHTMKVIWTICGPTGACKNGRIVQLKE